MTLRHRVLLGLLLGGAFIAGLLAFAPASLVGYALEHATHGRLALAETQGGLWQGSGIAVLKSGPRYQVLGRYRWTLQPWRAALQVQNGDAAPMHVRFAPFGGHLDIDGLHLTLPASILEIAAPQLGPYQLQGMFDARADHVALGANGMDGMVTVDWADAASGLSSIRPLGAYRIVLQGSGQAVDAQLSTLSGKLVLNAKGRYDAANGLQLGGTAQAAPEAAAELSEMLHHIGPEISPGVYNLALMPQARATP